LLDGGSRMPVGLRWSRPVRGACAPDREPCPWWHRRFGHIFCSDSGAPFGYGSRCVPLALLRRPRALWVVAESSVRVHACVLLLTLNTNKSAAGPACSSTPWLNHDSLGCYRLATIRSLTTFNDQNVTFAVFRSLAGASPSVPAGLEFLTPHSLVDHRRRDQPWDRSSKCLHFPQRRFH
jgi:hypothetical protein